MAQPGKFEEEALAALQRAVTRALDRKRRLGQYAVFWEDGQVIFDGPDAPVRRERAERKGASEPDEAFEQKAGTHITPEGPEA